MSKIIFILLLVAAGPVFAFDLPGMNAAGVKAAVPVPGTPAAVKAFSQHVWMSVASDPAAKEAQANDWNNRIEAGVRGSGNGYFSVNLRTDLGYTMASISKSGSNYSIWGSGLNLNMYGSGSYYHVSGSYFENGKTVFVSVNISGDGYNYNVYGSGLNLNASRGTINGWFDADQLPKKALAAVTAFILTLQIEAGQPAR